MEGPFEGPAAVGKRVRVFWDGEGEYFHGTVSNYNPNRAKKHYQVQYDDGDRTWEYHSALDFNVPSKPSSSISSSSSTSSHKKKKKKRTASSSQPPSPHSKSSHHPDSPKSEIHKKIVSEKEPTTTRIDPQEEDSEEQDVEETRSETSSVISRKRKKKKKKKRKRREDGDGDDELADDDDDAEDMEAEEKPRRKKKKKQDQEVRDDQHIHRLEDRIGRRCKVYWSGEKEYFYGQVVAVDSARNTLRVNYDDGDDEWERAHDVILVDDQSLKDVESKTGHFRSSAGDFRDVESSPHKRKLSSDESERKSNSDTTSDSTSKVRKENEGNSDSTSDSTSKPLSSVMPSPQVDNTGVMKKSREEENHDGDESGAGKEKANNNTQTLGRARARPVECGQRVEFFSIAENKVLPQDKIHAEIIGFNNETEQYLVALTGKGNMVSKLVILSQKENSQGVEGYITSFKDDTPPKTPLLLERISKSDSQSVRLMLSNPMTSLQPLQQLVEKDDCIYNRVLQKTPPHAKAEMLKLLLDSKAESLCDEEMCITLLQRCVEMFKDHILMRLIINRTHSANLSQNHLDELYHYCAEHVLRLNAEEKLDKIDQMLVETLSDTELGFKFDRLMKNPQGISGVTPSGPDNRTNTVVEGTPLLQAIARGNIPMAIRLMELEVSAAFKPHHNSSTQQNKGQDEEHGPQKKAGKLSANHWKCKLNDHWSSFSKSWQLQGSPIRLVLFFFIVTKSFSGPKGLPKILRGLERIAKINLDSVQLADENDNESLQQEQETERKTNDTEQNNDDDKSAMPPLLFLCTLTEKKLQIRVREAITQLITLGANPNIMDPNGLTPLLACVKYRTPKLIKILADSKKTDLNLASPLVEAVRLGHQEEIEALVACGAQLSMDVFAKCSEDGFVAQLFFGKLDLLKQIVHSMNPNDKKPVLSRLLIDACFARSPDLPLIDYLIASGADTDQVDENGNTALMVCIQRGSQKVLKRIINKARVDVNAAMNPNTGQSLLVWACQTGEQPIVKVLLDAAGDGAPQPAHPPSPPPPPPLPQSSSSLPPSVTAVASSMSSMSSAPPNAPESPVRNGGKSSDPPIQKASKSPMPVETSAGASSNWKESPVRNNKPRAHRMVVVRSIASQNALVAACESGSAALVTTLLNSGSDAIDVNATVQPLGWTPLHLASALGLAEVVDVLLDHGASVEKTDENNQTALSWASIRGDHAIIRILTMKGKSVVNHKDANGLTPLDLAIKHGHYKAAVELVHRGASLPNIKLKQ